jgi:hypothetical protein
MNKRRVKLISEIKSLKDLSQLKMQKRYERDLKKLEFKASLIQLELNLSPGNIKEAVVEESKNYFQDLVLKLLPSFFLKFFEK